MLLSKVALEPEDFFEVTIDDFRLYDVAIDATTVEMIYNGTL